MKVVLALPTLLDPAHRRVGLSLKRELARRGHRVRLAGGAAALRRLLRREKFDVCHVQYFSRGRLPAAFPPGMRVVLTHQGASLELLEDRAGFERLLKRADWVTAVSRYGLRELVEEFPGIKKRATAVYNGTDLPKEYEAVVRRPYILSVGRLASYKGTDVQLLAYAALRDRGQKLYIIGPDQTGGRIRRFDRRLGLEKRVRFLGARSRGEVARLMNGCTIFILASRKENCPMALLEAMAAGKACVASGVGGVPELIENGKTGLLVRPGNPGELARAMGRLLKEGKLRERLGRAAREKARKWSWGAAAEGYERVYRERERKGTAE